VIFDINGNERSNESRQPDVAPAKIDGIHTISENLRYWVNTVHRFVLERLAGASKMFSFSVVTYKEHPRSTVFLMASLNEHSGNSLRVLLHVPQDMKTLVKDCSEFVRSLTMMIDRRRNRSQPA
jgi:hypothetical protein